MKQETETTICLNCNGTGLVDPNDKTSTCPDCKGTGLIEVAANDD